LCYTSTLGRTTQPNSITSAPGCEYYEKDSANSCSGVGACKDVDLGAGCDTALLVIKNGDTISDLGVACRDAGILANGEACRFTCDDGYRPSNEPGHDDHTITCQEQNAGANSILEWNQEFVGTATPCAPNPCDGSSFAVTRGVVADIADVTESCAAAIPHGDYCKLVCDEGYEASGNGLLRCDKGKFEPQTCEPKSCDTQNLEIVHGVHDCGDEKEHSDTCTLTCPDDAFALSGSGVLTCELGTIVRGNSSCTGAPCVTLGLKIDHGEHDCTGSEADSRVDSIDSGSYCTLRCSRGYYIEGTVPPRRLEQDSEIDMSCDAGVLDKNVCVPRPCWPSHPSRLTIEHQRIHNCGDSSSSRLEANETCQLYCKDGYAPSNGGNMTCSAVEPGVLQLQTCEAMPCGPGQEAIGSICQQCKPDFYSPASGTPCKRCPLHSQPSADSRYCRCAEGYYYDHWTPALKADYQCKECVSDTLCRTLKNSTEGIEELTLVEAVGGTARQKAPGSWIHVESMSALHCLPGNCISCNDRTRTDLLLEPISSVELLQLLSRAEAVKQNRVNASHGGPPATAICDDGGSSECLQWEQQVIGTCCRRGHHGVLCADCDDNWVKAKGLCMPCQSFDIGKLLVLAVIYGGLCLFFWRKATLQLRRVADVDKNAQSSAINIMLFFFQTVTLLQIDVRVDIGLGALNLEPDTPSPGNEDLEGSCLKTGRFYVDWATKFTFPLLMAGVALLICAVTRVKPHERWRTLVLILNFGLFPCNLNALQIFFCRSEEQLQSPVLRSDPSIVCWNSEHILAFVASLLIFVVCAIATPTVLFQRIRQTLREQDEAHAKESVECAGELTKEEVEAYTAAFERYDVDGDGEIDDEEFSCILAEKTGIKASKEEIHELKEEYMGQMHANALCVDDFLALLALLKHELVESGNTQLHAMNDPLCLMYYPMRRECYWWSIIMLIRPTVIAMAFNARSRGTGMIYYVVDWRVAVVFILLAYSNLQASVQPFKLSHESWLDSVSVCMLMAIFVADVQKDIAAVDDNVFLIVVCVCALLVLAASAGLAQWYTRKKIR
jgi:hypothetical protein